MGSADTILQRTDAATCHVQQQERRHSAAAGNAGQVHGACLVSVQAVYDMPTSEQDDPAKNMPLALQSLFFKVRARTMHVLRSSQPLR